MYDVNVGGVAAGGEEDVVDHHFRQRISSRVGVAHVRFGGVFEAERKS